MGHPSPRRGKESPAGAGPREKIKSKGVGFEIICKRYNHSSPAATMRYLGIGNKEAHGVLMNEIGQTIDRRPAGNAKDGGRQVRYETDICHPSNSTFH